jgi:hypothetical protein
MSQSTEAKKALDGLVGLVVESTEVTESSYGDGYVTVTKINFTDGSSVEFSSSGFSDGSSVLNVEVN